MTMFFSVASGMPKHASSAILASTKKALKKL
jgi:hypothetical protein